MTINIKTVCNSINDFLNSSNITNKDVIITAIISSLIVVVILSILKICSVSMLNLIKKLMKSLNGWILNFFNIIKINSKKISLRLQGILTIEEYITLSQKKLEKLPLTKREEALLRKNSARFQNIPIISTQQLNEFQNSIKKLITNNEQKYLPTTENVHNFNKMTINRK